MTLEAVYVNPDDEVGNDYDKSSTNSDVQEEKIEVKSLSYSAFSSIALIGIQ